MERKSKNLRENIISYEELDWMEMLNSGTIGKEHACVLDKYIHIHNLLPVKGKNKSEKVNAFMDQLCSFAKSKQTKLPQCGRGG